MLALQSFRQHCFIETSGDQIVVRRALAREYRAAGVHQRQHQRRFEPLVFCLHMIGDSIMFNVGIVASNHSDEFRFSVARAS